ncbi:DUF1566 domain-containing protein [uncultured Thalassolituus sp.]|uniref:Lcl C-terminal domain-containing protein n=1 Tax=uncultured Thalassolituus sp. TaxID=285273 RepID=UPI00261EFD63|nr:DUF1566 domain-containing protein [uncultured Thalassolituus sp.]
MMKYLMLVPAAFSLCACMGDSQSSSSEQETTNTSGTSGESYRLSLDVSGLSSGGLIVENHLGDTLNIDSNGTYTFATEVSAGTAYLVSIAEQPDNTSLNCGILDGTGTMPDSAVSNIRVLCTQGNYNLVDTMQESCYASNGTETSCAGTGYDADYTSNTASYTLSHDGAVVYDNVTGLSWTQTNDINGDGQIRANDKLSQPDAASYCSALTTHGLNWRLPSVKEAYSLIDFRGGDPSNYSGSDTSSLTPFIDDAVFDVGFGDTSSGERIIDGQMATSTLYASPEGTISGAGTMFGVNFIDGRIKGYPYDYPVSDPKTFYVYCVSGNEAYGTNDFLDNSNGTLLDMATGLTWQQGDTTGLDFEDAVSYCEDLTLASFSDWRLPDAKELQSIIDYSRAPDYTSSAATDTLFTNTSMSNEAGETDWHFYWASTTHAKSSGAGDAGVYFALGRALGYYDQGSGLEMVDVHGAGAQRSNNKAGHDGDTSVANLGYGSFRYKGPQGDISRFENAVRCVRDTGEY